MDTFVCPKGHNSTESDYCSECGARMIASAAADPAPAAEGIPAAPASARSCPSCGASRDDSGIAFCEVCGANFSAPAQPSSAPAQPAAQVSAWTVTISVDPALHGTGSPEPPAEIAASTLTLAQGVSLIGRRSEVRAIFPEISIPYDDAISHRHALLQLFASGVLLLRDIGAANGTRLNGKQIDPMVDHPLQDGDQITLGHWSRITVRAIF